MVFYLLSFVNSNSAMLIGHCFEQMQVFFLYEFCSLSKSLQMVQQRRLFMYANIKLNILRCCCLGKCVINVCRFFHFLSNFFNADRDLVNEGIFDIISDALQSQDKRLVLTG